MRPIPRRATDLTSAVAVPTVCALLLGLLLPAAAAADIVPVRPALAAVGLPTTMTLTAAPEQVALGATTSLAGRLTDPSTGGAFSGATVHLETPAADGSWTELAQLTTDSGGAVRSDQAVTAVTTYRLRHGDPGAAEASVSPSVTVTVLPLTAALSREAVQVGGTVRVSGMLASGEGETLRLERRSAGEWRRVDRIISGPGGAYGFPVSPSEPGFWRLRVARGDGSSAVELPVLDAYRLHRYSVRTRGTVRADMGTFRDSVAATYADPRGWLRAHHRFRAVTGGRVGDFTVVLSQARYLPTYSWECSTTYSCRVGRYVIINQDRWRGGSPFFPGTLEQYRRMVVNHETGHWLGRGHAYCSGPGRLAPVMQQQSKGLHGCRVNPWPLDREIRAVS
ncbi:MAG TPA: DUF3152 domain-containing protein [Actinomycetes bacterium]